MSGAMEYSCALCHRRVIVLLTSRGKGMWNSTGIVAARKGFSFHSFVFPSQGSGSNRGQHGVSCIFGNLLALFSFLQHLEYKPDTLILPEGTQAGRDPVVFKSPERSFDEGHGTHRRPGRKHIVNCFPFFARVKISFPFLLSAR